MTDGPNNVEAEIGSPTNGWREYKLRVLYQLETLSGNVTRLEADIRELTTKISTLSNELSVLKTKMGFIAAFIGFISSIIGSLLVAYVKGNSG